MKRAICLLALCLGSTAIAKPEPVRFRDPSFTVTFPSPPVQHVAVESDVMRSAPPIEVHSYLASGVGQVAQIKYFDMPGLWNGAAAMKDSQGLLKFGLRMQLLGLCAQTVQKMGGQLESTEKIALDGAFGMSFGGTLQEQLGGQPANVHGRIYFRGDRIFTILIMHTADAKGAVAAATFLESFAFTPPTKN